MAEFCLKCWNKINEKNDDEGMFVISRELDLCEGCGKWKHVIVKIRSRLFFVFRKKRKNKGTDMLNYR